MEEKGVVVKLQREGASASIEIEGQTVASDASIGDSICVSGCCLTVVAIDGAKLTFEAGDETLDRTALGLLDDGDHVNLERSLAVGQRMGGHYVSGHIDGTGKILDRNDDGEWARFTIGVDRTLAIQMASKGSVAVDGISLTLCDVTDEQFEVALIPHTLDMTTIGQRASGDTVNIETDLLAKYVQRQLAAKELS